MGAAPAALVGRSALHVVDVHRPAAAAAVDDALAKGRPFAHRAGAGVGVVGGEFRLVRQELIPGDVAGMLAEQSRFPLCSGHAAAAAGATPVRTHPPPAPPPPL